MYSNNYKKEENITEAKKSYYYKEKDQYLFMKCMEFTIPLLHKMFPSTHQHFYFKDLKIINNKKEGNVTCKKQLSDKGVLAHFTTVISLSSPKKTYVPHELQKYNSESW